MVTLAAHFGQGRYDVAARLARAMTLASPQQAFGWKVLGAALAMMGHSAQALAAQQRAVELAPQDAEAHCNLANSLRDLGALAQAAAGFRRALAIRPDYALAHSNLLFTLSHDADVAVPDVLQQHQRFGQQFDGLWQAPPHTNERSPNRPLRLGFVSRDLRRHAVAFFIEPIWRHLKRTEFTLVAYHCFVGADDYSARLGALCDSWVACAGLSDDALAARIRHDQIDILFDLAGHTALNRLAVFARKPAPLQVSWIGYPLTTGLAAMDYRISDRFRAPPGMEAQFVEKLARLPSSGTFDTLVQAPPVSPLPALANGYVTFGSFQRRTKLGHATLLLWSQVLQAVPGSRLLLGAMDEHSMQAELSLRFADLGIDPQRLIFQPKVDLASYLALHHQVDILLDSYPYPGGTTTQHGLWMGVPTLTRTGESPASWQGAAVLLRLGLAQWVAASEAEFVRAATAWAADLTALAALRLGLRERVVESVLGRPETVTRALEAALRVMWQRWCAGQAPDHFEVSL